jgi:hypothetical protein
MSLHKSDCLYMPRDIHNVYKKRNDKHLTQWESTLYFAVITFNSFCIVIDSDKKLKLYHTMLKTNIVNIEVVENYAQFCNKNIFLHFYELIRLA